jgi:hypothetical protein
LAIGADHSSGNGDRVAEKRGDGSWILDDRATRQRTHERTPVPARSQPGIENRDDTAVAVAADQPPEALSNCNVAAGSA